MQQTVVRYAGPAIDLAWHPTDDLLAIATFDKQMIIWSQTEGRVVAATETHAVVESIAWSPDGVSVAMADQEEAVTLWDSSTNDLRVLGRTETPTDMGIHQLAWSSKGTLASVGGDLHIKIWDLNTDSIAQQFRAWELARQIAWSPDGTHLACANYDNSVLIWDPENEAVVASLESDDVAPSSVAWSPEGGRLVVAGTALLVWDLSADTQSVFSDRLESPTSVAWSPDGVLLATAEFEQARVWDLATGSAIQLFPGFGSEFQTVGWSADGAKMAFAGMSAPYVWIREPRTASEAVGSPETKAETNTEKPVLKPLPGYLSAVKAMALSPDGKRVVFADEHHVIRTWTPRSSPDDNTNTSDSVTSGVWKPQNSAYERMAARLKDPLDVAELNLEKRCFRLRDLVWSPDGTRFASIGEESVVRVWDPDAVETIRALPDSINLYSLCWSPDGTRLATSGIGSQITVWSPETGTSTEVDTDHSGAINSLAWAPDGERLVSVGRDGLIRVWTVAENPERGLLRRLRKSASTPTLSLETDDDSIDLVAWSPDGTKFSTLTRHRHRARAWDAVTGQELESPDWGYCMSVGWLAGGAELGAVSDSGKTVVWNLENNRVTTAHFTGHGGPIRVASWSSVDHRIATAGADNTIKIWDPTTGEEIDRFPRVY